MVATPSIRAARITNMSGNTLAYSNETGSRPIHRFPIRSDSSCGHCMTANIFDDGKDGIVAAEEIEVDNMPVAVAWVYPDTAEDQVDLSSLLRSALFFALLAIAANALFSSVAGAICNASLARSAARHQAADSRPGAQ